MNPNTAELSGSPGIVDRKRPMTKEERKDNVYPAEIEGEALDAAALTQVLKARIASFKVPKAIFIEAELPRNAMGKVQKNVLRERHRGLFA